VPLPSKTVSTDVQALQRGLLFLFVIGLMRVVVLKGGEIGEEVHSVGKVTKETKGIPSSSVNWEFFWFT
jgi:hypothetical protein